MASLFRAGVDIFLTEIRSRFVSLFSFFLPPLSFLSFFSFPPFFFSTPRSQPRSVHRSIHRSVSISIFDREHKGSTRSNDPRAISRTDISRVIDVHGTSIRGASNSNATRLRRTLVVDSRRMQQGTSKLRTLSMIMTTIREIRNV